MLFIGLLSILLGSLLIITYDISYLGKEEINEIKG